ncbi:hypothetical protein HK097_001039 [Rhizophlyctis rosea]|uniref:PH domain-containing protein n=1 Tax=Rhizophlyctis rosea TaxID=64517 RepID=A0AAD5X982_9FUNG|nr:hypothetical protein HK097_001039 [Rhizophlyctis rosea]
MDPWLTERVLYAQLRRMVGAENTFQAQMVKMQEQLAAFDRWCVEEVKTILEDFAGIKGSSLNGIGAQISNLTTTLTAIPSESQFLNFSVRHLLTHPHTDLYTRPRSLPTFPYQVREIQIQRQGILYRPGAVRKNAWKPVVAVLTETGFLHIFDCSLSKVTRRVTSVGGVEGVGLGGGRMVLSGGDMCLEPRDWAPDGDGTDTASRRSSVSGSSVSESEGSGDREGMSPGTESHVYNNLDKPATRFSICLSQPRVTVGQSLNHQLTTVFTITVGAQPRRQSLVGGLMKSKQETRTYDLKAGSEEEMVEWVEILKRKIEQYIPEGPPAPFTHPTLSTASLPRQPSTTEAPLTDTTHRRHSLLRPKSPPPPPSLPLHNPSQTSDAVSIADSQEPEPHSSNLLLDTATAAMKTAMKGPSMVLDVAAAAMETAMAVGHLKQEKEGHDRAPRVGEPSPASLAAAAEGNTTTAEAAMVQQAPPVAV